MHTNEDERMPLRVAHHPADAPHRPAMSNERDRHDRVALTSRHVELDGRPTVPVSGELHFSRVPRAEWEERLRLMRSGGVTVVSTYLIWIHHEPERGRIRFDGGLDVAAFVRFAARVGLDVVIRIGPWCHGEVRNGGFPDWVAAASVAHRTDDPAYLALARGWFAAIGGQLAALCGPGSPIIGIQVENELIDQPGHLRTLTGLAREAGLTAPIWTATAWDGAELPPDVVMPVFGGYADGFWVDADAPWPSSFRAHFRFSHDWDDPGIGADLRPDAAPGRTRTAASPDFPIATCELGGGMATAYHRRPLLDAGDIAAVANAKLGSGSNWQGYYMYAGGVNPGDGLQESLATGYPNDLPRLDYDFHAPIGAAGQLAPSHAVLRVQHAFLAAFGERLAPMTSSLPDRMPRGDDDRETLRWALRSDGGSGFLFVDWHQPFEPLDPVEGVRFAVDLGSRELLVPSADRPALTIPPGTVARWPLALPLGGVVVEWATASVLTVLGGDVPTLVFLAEAGIPAMVAVRTDAASPPLIVEAVGADETFHHVRDDAALDVLLLPAAWADGLWVLDARSGERMLLRSRTPLWLDDDDDAAARSAADPCVERWNANAGRFEPVAMRGDPAPTRPPTVTLERPAGLPLAVYGGTAARRAAPSPGLIDELASAHRVDDIGAPSDGVCRVLEVAWAGDVATLDVDGRTVADRFWDGTPWLIDLDALGVDASSHVVLRILPLHPDAAVHLPPDASARRRATDGPLGELDRLAVHRTAVWHEAP